MASKYLLWKYRDVRPDEPPCELTAAEKRANWWYYHKWHVILGLVLVLVLGNVLWSAVGPGKESPDCQVAYVGSTPLPEDTVSALENALASLGGSEDGDGRIAVKVNQYVFAGESGNAMYAYAANAAIMADLTSCESYFFLLEDPDTFQRNYKVLCRLDGTLPSDFDQDNDGCYLSWTDCPALTELELGDYSETVQGQTVTGENQEVLSHLYIAHRGFYDKTVSDPDKCDALWAELMKGIF